MIVIGYRDPRVQAPVGFKPGTAVAAPKQKNPLIESSFHPEQSHDSIPSRPLQLNSQHVGNSEAR